MPWIVYSPEYYVDMGEHVFPVEKYRLCCRRLVEEGTITEADVAEPTRPPDEDLLLAHTEQYLAHMRRLAAQGGGFLTPDTPITEEILDKAILSAGGTTLAGRLALEERLVVHLSGGFHHAYADHGEGFCYINDVAVAIRVLQRDGLIERALILDCDLHQGNGTAAIFRGDESVFTFSIHEQDNYPIPKERSDLDIGLRSGTGDEEYLAKLHEHVPLLLDQQRPDLAFYLAGADPYEHDQLGRLRLTMEGLQQRDELVLGECWNRGVPCVVLLAGGYAFDTADTVEIHCRMVGAAKRIREGRG
ncbi:MAG: histone deacetylase [Armatimonadota bacterium]